jgi:hypothetical protein
MNGGVLASGRKSKVLNGGVSASKKVEVLNSGVSALEKMMKGCCQWCFSNGKRKGETIAGWSCFVDERW